MRARAAVPGGRADAEAGEDALGELVHLGLEFLRVPCVGDEAALDEAVVHALGCGSVRVCEVAATDDGLGAAGEEAADERRQGVVDGIGAEALLDDDVAALGTGTGAVHVQLDDGDALGAVAAPDAVVLVPVAGRVADLHLGAAEGLHAGGELADLVRLAETVGARAGVASAVAADHEYLGHG